MDERAVVVVEGLELNDEYFILFPNTVEAQAWVAKNEENLEECNMDAYVSDYLRVFDNHVEFESFMREEID